MTMAKEMEKAGLIEEMVSDVMDNDPEIDEAADEELDKVIDEITMGLKTANVSRETPGLANQQAEKGDNMSALEARLDSLKS